MYVPKHHQLNDREALFALMEASPFGAWVCMTDGGLIANHVPFFLDQSKGPFGTLVGHVSRANEVWHKLNPDTPSMVLFQGPQAYITPSWYPGKAEHGKVVPTWNYTVAHAHGIARVIEDRDWLLAMLNRLTHAQEVSQPMPWKISDAPADYIDKLLRGIVGIEIPIDRLEGKLKASQEKDLPTRNGIMAGLQQAPSDDARLMAELVRTATDNAP